MIVFEVSLNGARLCTAGVDAGVLSAILGWVGGEPIADAASRVGPLLDGRRSLSLIRSVHHSPALD
jgi:hypothetical protein